MSSKWKYANLDAETRLEMLRSGNKEVFDEEVERTKSVTKARKELGLDTTEQENWMDTVGYNYSLHTGANQGEAKDSISKTGYAKLYLRDEESEKNEPMSKVKAYKTTPGFTSTPISDATWKIKDAGEKAKTEIKAKYASLKENAKNEFYKKYPYLDEAIINSGASLEGGKAAKIRADLDAELSKIYGEYDKAMKAELSASEKKYDGLVETLLGYRRDGLAKSSLGTVADMLIYEASLEDGYEAENPAKPAVTARGIYGDSANSSLEKILKESKNRSKAESSAKSEDGGEMYEAESAAGTGVKTSDEDVGTHSSGGSSDGAVRKAAQELVKISASLSVPEIIQLLISYGVSTSDAKDIAARLSEAGIGA